MSGELPHLTQKITTLDSASYEMRSWMERVSSALNPVFSSISSSTYTTSGNEFLRFTAACTVTLNASPENGEIVEFQPDGSFTITINGPINGGSSTSLSTAYDFLKLRYVVELGEWVG